ncbi:regulator of sigma E protease [Zhouia amylolytica]|uniref:Zinc metalloprotease n=1 Tax=Zhouia amylolytica TaxID=376730 RepID=A0A1I6PB45_9FLAO|nr:RIP metalloprotease RseP [Zhouia amylolytica]MCQ0111396.1 RIP metalloprotease RseP [Zhouia amylolytica]SFS37424.1 regulator of sigma E protease [Zhouia amylolytica]
MSPILVKTLQLLLSLSILIVLHELGHFIPAKLFKTRVEKFFLFFDVKFALFKKKIGETVYGIGWLPLGGYVKISGMIDESMDKDQMAGPPQPWEFRSKPAWQRLIIMVGGVTVNLILGFVIYMMILFVWGQEQLKPEDMPHGFAVVEEMEQFGFKNGDKILSVNDKELDNALRFNSHLLVRDVSNVKVEHIDGTQETLRLPDTIGDYIFKKGLMPAFQLRTNPILDTIIADSQAEKAGLLKGDKVLAVDGKNVTFFDEIGSHLKDKPNYDTQLVVERGNQIDTITATTDEDGKLGIYSLQGGMVTPKEKKFGFGEAVWKGFAYGYWTLHDYVVQFKYIFTKEGATQVGGFGTIAKMFPSVWDWQSFWMSTALISIILAFMNILPIPALDGGHVMFLLYEMITGRKPSDKFLEYAQMIGFFLLIALLLFANGNDIYRWLSER